MALNHMRFLYLCVMMSIKFWWVLIKKFIVYGLTDAISSVILYYATDPKDRDLHQKFKYDNHFELKGSKILSIIAAFMISLWIALAVIVVRTRANNVVISLCFWIIAIWTIILLTYIVELTLVKAKEQAMNTKNYYLKALFMLFHCPQITITTITLLVTITLLFIKNAVIAVLIMPGVIAACVCHTYNLLIEKEKEKLTK